VKKLLLFALLMPALALAIFDVKWFDVNHWSAPFDNWGSWGIDYGGSGHKAGGSWPQPLKNYYIFGAGPWIGAVVPTSSPETLCTVGYDPNNGGGEMFPALCRYWREGHDDSLDRVYKYPDDWPPPLSRFPMAPQEPLSDMDLWCCFGDSDPSFHSYVYDSTCPLGIDVYQTVYGFLDSLTQDFFFIKYELTNCRGEFIPNAYFGQVVDADIGDPSDDMSGLILDSLFQVGPDTIRVKNVGFVFDSDNREDSSGSWESGVPGAVVFMLLAAPDSLGLTALKRFSIDIDPVTNMTQYLTLAGYNYRTGEYRPYDSSYIGPADVRMLLSTGPFDLAPNATVTLWYAILGTPYNDTGACLSGRDPSDLALRCKWARDIYNQRLAGITEETMNDQRGTMNVGPTIVRGVLFLGDCPRTGTVPKAVLLDVSGREVLDLQAGANDVGSFAPGVYFVRETQAQAQATRKVVLTR
jgi:hypothetical protein